MKVRRENNIPVGQKNLNKNRKVGKYVAQEKTLEKNKNKNKKLENKTGYR